MIEFITPDDRAILAESFGRALDDATLERLLVTAREHAEQRYIKTLRIWPETLAAYLGQMAAYERAVAHWTLAKEMYDAQSRNYARELAAWHALPNRGDFASPTPPTDPGPAPEMPDAPVEPVPPTDADAVAMMMVEQRAAVARSRLEPAWEPVADLGIERAEIVNEAFDLVMSRLAVNQPAAQESSQEPAQLLPPVDTLMADYGAVGGVAPDLADIMLPDEPLAAAVERMTPGLDELLDMAQLLSEPSFEAAIVTIPTERFNEWTERLFAERGVLRTRRGTDDENLARENLISRVATVFARVGAKR